MSNDESVKWLCLFECLDIVSNFCERDGLDLEHTITRRLKPNHIKNYIRERFPQMYNDIDTGRITMGDTFAYRFIYNGK
jgi:hypothetical protein